MIALKSMNNFVLKGRIARLRKGSIGKVKCKACHGLYAPEELQVCVEQQVCRYCLNMALNLPGGIDVCNRKNE
jgi:hypothetical protein